MSEKKKLTNKALMLAMGSKSGRSDPEPPDQWRYLLMHGSPTEQAVAWTKSKTIAYGHQTPYATDAKGRHLKPSDLAEDRGWTLQTARNVLGEAEKQGRIRLKRTASKGQAVIVGIGLSADVPKAHQDGRKEGDDSNSVQSWVPAYVIEFINTLDEKERKKSEAVLEGYKRWRTEFEAAVRRQERAVIEQVEDSTFQAIGIPKKRLPKRAPIEPAPVQLELLVPPNFVQTPVQSSVQNGKPASYETKNGAVQTGASLLTTDKTVRTERAPAASSVIEPLPPKAAAAANPLPAEKPDAIKEPAAPDSEYVEVCAHFSSLGLTKLPDPAYVAKLKAKFEPTIKLTELPKVRKDQRSAALWMDPKITPQQMNLQRNSGTSIPPPRAKPHEQTAEERHEDIVDCWADVLDPDTPAQLRELSRKQLETVDPAESKRGREEAERKLKWVHKKTRSATS